MLTMDRARTLIPTMFRRITLRRCHVHLSPLCAFSRTCEFEDHIYIDRFTILHRVRVGRYSYIASNCELANCDIGRFCSIAGGVKIGLGSHPTNYAATSPVFYSRTNCLKVDWNEDASVIEFRHTVIGNDVWIGTNTIVVGGTTIGDGAVIGASAVVTKDIPPYTVVGGVPARPIRQRFPEETIARLQDSKWWNWPEDRLRARAKDVANVAEFLKEEA